MTANKDDKTRIVTDNNRGNKNGSEAIKNNPAPTAKSDATVIAPSAKRDDATVIAQPSLSPSSTPVSPPTPETTFSSENRNVIKGRFELVSLLGAGGMGAVYKALDRRKVEASDSDPYVAVKLLNDDFREHPDAFISLQRESRKSQTLAHPNIVTVYDFDRDKETVFMTMEFLEGAPLDELLREHPHGMPAEESQNIIRDISNALIYAHSHNIIHSDFKPGNIYVTKNKGAKVFDFGIARAVSGGSAVHGAGEKTIFDAGTLGALTPAYASNEMLQGREPSESDDVYALGCVAYELFCGKHPYNKTPADEAVRKKLKPKRLKGLSRRQWNALASAIELTRNTRTATVSEFYEGFFGKPRVLMWSLVASLTAMTIAGGTYFVQYQEQAAAQAQLKVELEQELNQKLEQTAINNQLQTLNQLVQLSALTPKWDREVRKELETYKALVPDDKDTAIDVARRVSTAYLSESRLRIADNNLENVLPLLQYASRWNAPEDEVSMLTNQVLTQQEADRLREENARLAEAQKEAERLREEQERREKELAQARKIQIEQEVTRLESALRCPNQIDVGGQIAGHLGVLETLAPERSSQLRNLVAGSLVQCFNKLSKVSPHSAEIMLNEAKALLPEQTALNSLQVDYCSHLAPGTGAKGRRYTCADPLPHDAKGPTMVVVPSPVNGHPIAISQYEITYDDIADYCTVTQLCDGSVYANNMLPVNNIDIEFAENFAGWLSYTTGHEYRIPTYDEWLVAAIADGSAEQPDRNCFLKYGAIEKGTELHKTNNGKPNAYGLVSHVGNVQEWAYRDHSLVAAGGARTTPMNECRFTTVKPHNGSPDEVTGFRLVRELVAFSD